MRQGWKRVAERGDNAAFSADEVSAALVRALKLDCSHEVDPIFLDALRTVCIAEEYSLFKDQFGTQLEMLRTNAAGSGIGCTALDEAIRLAVDGERGEDVAVKALDTALTDHAARGARQVEEHYLRESTKPRSDRVRGRMDQAISTGRDDITGLARQLLKGEKGSIALHPLKQLGLDDGVRL